LRGFSEAFSDGSGTGGSSSIVMFADLLERGTSSASSNSHSSSLLASSMLGTSYSLLTLTVG